MENFKEARTLVLIAIAALSLITGAAMQYLQPGQHYGPIGIGSMLLQAFLLFVWFHLDAERLQYKTGFLLKVAVIGLALVAIPYYLFRSRGWRRGLVTTLGFFVLIILTLALEYAGAVGVYRFVQS
jgi:hypothetical protein